MEHKCECGTTVEVDSHEILAGTYRCPNCGRINKLKAKTHPKPLIAIVLSLVFPGIGHLYAGGTTFAILTMVSTVLLSNALYALMVFWDAAPFNIVIPILLSLIFFVSVLVSAAKKAKEYHTLRDKPKRPGSVRVYVGLAIVFVTAEIMLVPIFGSYRTYFCPTGSMEDAIMIGDRILVDLGAYNHEAPLRGDLVILLYPGDHSTAYVERCAAVGGDTIEIVDKALFVNGLMETIPATVQHRDPGLDARRDNFGPYIVPPNCYFMLGDNRDDSYDSRFWGPVPRELVMGKPVRVVYNSHIGRIGLALK